MNTSIGPWPLGSASSSSLARTHPTALEIVRLLLLGAGAVVVHGLIRGRLGLGPGHQGLLWIAVLVLGRLTSPLRWAGLTSSLGASATAMMPVWGFGDPFRWLTYLIAGAVVDLSRLGLGRWWARSVVIILVGGLAHGVKPLVRTWITSTSGWPYESLLAGLTYPVWMHALFGLIGAAVAVAGVRARVRRRGL